MLGIYIQEKGQKVKVGIGLGDVWKDHRRPREALESTNEARVIPDIWGIMDWAKDQ